MAKSALLKSSIGKKYWMALTGLFLCLFLVGHLAGNLQLIFGTDLQFNQYAYFMTTNPAVKILSYVTYFSILFHAVDGIVLTIQNKKARPIGYVKNNAAANSAWQSRNMAVLGTLLLVFIATHMVNFWAKMHFSEMPLQQQEMKLSPMPGMELKAQGINTTNGGIVYKIDQEGKTLFVDKVEGELELRNNKDFYAKGTEIKVAEGYKDLYKITIEFFKDKKLGLVFTLFYVFSMIVLAFHLMHGFASAFQSLGAYNPKYNGLINGLGKFFAIIVPLLFAIIPIYIHFIK
ncbi:succinate dehydrogenase cytochrome b subunit [Myroides sp. JBRI-B21084]|uniref:succinate dehydrogenase cytochrome b subunit n=1 Tax=Myroides sp. JBRI-B21084 TaxID=3119977 RepID=UPI0026E3183D|nr:succinate dehydrogenase cytochrome b subunit [Paenimyroides cloacae]WKW46137.1 succinate dehydrogenase cytochrome b subunit [Paenimyroides cloacae]